MPRSARLQLTVPADSLAALDFLALRGCALQTTVAKRNTSLGRLAAPSQRLLLELEFLRQAPPCIDYLRARDDNTLADALAALMLNKVEQLPARIYNATLASEEFRALWQIPAVLGDYPTQTSSAPITALESISAQARRWLSGDYRADETAFELQLSEVARADAGSLLLALARQRAGLAAAGRMFAARAARGPLCRPDFVNREAQTLRNVIGRFFINGVQPWSAALERRRHGLLPPLLALEQTLAPVLPPDYLAWRDWRERQLRQGSRAPAEHVAQIQTLLDSCSAAEETATGLAPAASG
jgi:hypothetical protein